MLETKTLIQMRRKVSLTQATITSVVLYLLAIRFSLVITTNQCRHHYLHLNSDNIRFRPRRVHPTSGLQQADISIDEGQAYGFPLSLCFILLLV